ncbi:salt-induced outer membrane protein [Arsukibacterium ikkense]|uniref:Salt-induced outer membrane protein n=2 Tax=Arsukibacterium ikkense TaxID=336831 RepID=A0A0M2V4D4_9GAMM|nr:salt-induced outer membrane protein [Arsukibacterium ikkense]
MALPALAAPDSDADGVADGNSPTFQLPLDFLGTIGGDIELGLLFNSGNTDAYAVRINSELVHELEYFRNRYQLYGRVQRSKIFNAQTQEHDSVTTAKRYGMTGQSNYKFLIGRQSLFGRGAYLYDMFGAFRVQSSLAAGYANRVYEMQTNYIDLETGPGFAHQRSNSGLANTGLIWFLAFNLEQKVYEGSTFRQTFEGSVSLDGANSTFVSRSSITAQLFDKLSMRFSFVARHNSRPEGKLKTMDTETAASVVYTF